MYGLMEFVKDSFTVIELTANTIPNRVIVLNRFKLILDPLRTHAVSGNFNWNLSDARGFDLRIDPNGLVSSTRDSAPGAPKCAL